VAGRDNHDLSGLPSVERVRSALGVEHPHAIAVAVARRAIDRARAAVRAGGPTPELDQVVTDARGLLEEHQRSLLTPIINATGVLLHTNLGRAPLGPRQLDAVARIAGGYSNLEYDLTTGTRGSRYVHAQGLLTALTGAESGVIVNNNAAAVLVSLAALCGGREVIISRGELIEIGGEFRIPDILKASGAHLVEVGTTNRTHLADYERAITSETAAILKVHPSNYTMVGFTASVAPRDIARLARGRKIRFIHDVGSGSIAETASPSEPIVRDALEDGADVVTFSGDKLLGGPQAGIIVGDKKSIEKISLHPLMRAVRVDKMTLAALEETLKIYLEGARAALPLDQMSNVSAEELEARAHRLAADLGEVSDLVKVEVVPHAAVAGGGSMPGTEIASWALSIRHATRSSAEIGRALRHGRPPVIAQVDDDKVFVDLRTVAASDDTTLIDRLLSALS
jgi:L-seryl-tRNA(Ser) seleniumtransferase